MKSRKFGIVFSAFALLLLASPSWSADSVPSGSVDFANMSSEKVLHFYKELSSCELVQSSDVKNHHGNISVRGSGSKDEVLKLIEKVLIEQAGIVITRLDERRVSVTFNDALPITPVVRKNPVGVKILR